ncbi:hypothetical protein ACJJTC_000956 [Scirpophaga incertulas]
MLNVAQVNSGNIKPVLAKIMVGSTVFLGAKNIPRPQLTFKDPVDNSDSLWVPKIADKPNNIKPLALSILYNDEGEAVGYEHPYKIELELYRPSLTYFKMSEEPKFPASLDETSFTMVVNEEQVNDLIAHLSTVDELAVDLEHHSYRTYQGITCLIQITTDTGGDFIVDALAVREHLHKLNVIFTDPKKLKVFHGAEMDVVWLQRDFGVYIVGLFDTHQAARVLKLNALSLKHLLMHYCGIDADKKFQLADWRIRPLPDEMVTYARSDTHYLLFIWRCMRRDLLALEQGKLDRLLSVFERSRQVCNTTYNKSVLREDSHMELYLRSKKSFNVQQMAALKMLFKWRDQQARELDESTSYLIPNHMLITLAEALPRELQGVCALCNPTPPFVKQNTVAIHRMLLTCRELPLEPQLFQMPSSVGTMVHMQPIFLYPVHDMMSYDDFFDELPLDLEPVVHTGSATPSRLCPDVPAFKPSAPPLSPPLSPPPPPCPKPFVSDLNVNAKLFIPPYDRYCKYRVLAQIEELKEYKKKEAKIAALGQGDELIKKEVLEQIQKAKEKTERELKEEQQKVEEAKKKKEKERVKEEPGEKLGPKENFGEEEDESKMEEGEEQDGERAPFDTPDVILVESSKRAKRRKGKVDGGTGELTKSKMPAPAPKNISYKNVSYKKFYAEPQKARKQRNMKLKKNK